MGFEALKTCAPLLAYNIQSVRPWANYCFQGTFFPFVEWWKHTNTYGLFSVWGLNGLM